MVAIDDDTYTFRLYEIVDGEFFSRVIQVTEKHKYKARKTSSVNFLLLVDD